MKIRLSVSGMYKMDLWLFNKKKSLVINFFNQNARTSYKNCIKIAPPYSTQFNYPG